mgnify:CR=1 FL=1
MSTYVREKVLRIPVDKINFEDLVNELQKKHPDENVRDDFNYYLEFDFPELFGYGEIKHFQTSPTTKPFIDYVLEYEWDCDGEYGKVRELYDSEKEKFRPVFQKIDPDINMDDVRLVEYCWYNGSEAPDYYDLTKDPFYKELA